MSRKDMYEFQMLYGVTPKLRDSIVSAGHTHEGLCSFRETMVWLFNPQAEGKPKDGKSYYKGDFL